MGKEYLLLAMEIDKKGILEIIKNTAKEHSNERPIANCSKNK